MASTAAPQRRLALVALVLAVSGLVGVSFVASPSSRAGGPLRATRSIGSAHARGEVPQPSAQPRSTGAALAACCVGSLVLAAGVLGRSSAVARHAEKPKAEVQTADIPRPEDLLTSPKFPLYMGGDGGYFSKGTRERHAITWTSKAEMDFEMPT
eukprot:CAMPEP_0117510256 /NCGR_PEP_ID=MMETSP0784-20121206/27897_1 /TAXON_ID=39447 /ORGANISM="" /LENGTH=153 /DNA_ID=CAMNT_0005305889 /DNA_START=72 /DNA_END=529 /DNA_ORIENTATION=-